MWNVEFKNHYTFYLLLHIIHIALDADVMHVADCTSSIIM
jgi:hypothetical protein